MGIPPGGPIGGGIPLGMPGGGMPPEQHETVHGHIRSCGDANWAEKHVHKAGTEGRSLAWSCARSEGAGLSACSLTCCLEPLSLTADVQS